MIFSLLCNGKYKLTDFGTDTVEATDSRSTKIRTILCYIELHGEKMSELDSYISERGLHRTLCCVF